MCIRDRLDRDRGQQEAAGVEQKAKEPILYQVNNSLIAGNKKITGTGGQWSICMD